MPIVLEVSAKPVDEPFARSALREGLLSGRISTFDELLDHINNVSQDNEGVDLL